MRFLVLIALLSFSQYLFGQAKPLVYTNDSNAYYKKNAGRNSFFESKINEITLNPDSTFEFWSRPSYSCFTWHSYEGTWQRHEDTIVFHDQYEILERDVKVIYDKDSKKMYRINFHTDKNSSLKNKQIQVEYVYDYDSHLDDVKKVFYLDTANSIKINFTDIPNQDKLASIRIEYLLDYYKKRYYFLTESDVVNNKKGEIPNIIEVEFLEFPRNENVYRTIKAELKCNDFRVISVSKTPTTLFDYGREILFEDIYHLEL